MVVEGKKQAILDAALELFAERGFHGTAVPLIAKRARVGAGTVYRYFESKEALVNELYRHWKEEMNRRVTLEYPASAPPREQFRHWWNRLARFALDEASRRMELTLLESARGLVVATQKAGITVKVTPDLVIAFVFGALVGIVKMGWQEFVKVTPEALAAGEDLAWRAIART